jgi:iron complex transport system ATP-binding protein
MTDALVAEHITVRRNRRVVVDDVSLRAAYGEVTALIGPNGAGKSTLLRALLGILPADGFVSIAGSSLRTLSPRERARTVAYVPQQSQLTANVRVRDVVTQGRFAHGENNSSDKIERALEDAQVSPLAARAFNQLSGGEQRRVLLARALATDARVLLLDEPTAGLDVGQVIRFHRLMRTLTERGLAILSVLHDLTDVCQYADRAILLSRGRVVTAGAASAVIGSAETERVYGVRLTREAIAPFELAGEAQ